MKKNTFKIFIIIGLFLVCQLVLSFGVFAQEITANNTARYVNNERWDWTVFIEAPPNILSSIKEVEYTLHPSFPNPVRTVNRIGDQRFPFALSSNGWGVFEITIRVYFKNGQTRFLRHTLSFESQAQESVSLRANNVAKPAGEGWWKWTTFIEGNDNDLNQIRCVEYTLHPSFPEPVTKVCDRGNGPHAFPVSATGWGTFQIKIRIFLKNGQVKNLNHNLKL